MESGTKGKFSCIWNKKFRHPCAVDFFSYLEQQTLRERKNIYKYGLENYKILYYWINKDRVSNSNLVNKIN